MPTSSRPVLCLGDPLVDLVCERPASSLSEAGAFTPHFGGAAASVAVLAARDGVATELLGSAGEDAWGAWLAERLEREGVGRSHFRLIPDQATPIAFTLVGADGEATNTLYGAGPAGVTHFPEEELEAAVGRASGLFLSSSTLVGEAERAGTMGMREQALSRGIPIVFDANLRLHGWRSRADAAASANACVGGALLVRASAEEARLMTGEEDLERAASAMLKGGAAAVVISLGPGGAIMRGELRVDAPASKVEVRSTSGAGDVLTGLLLARLARSGWYLPAAAAGLREAVAQASLACARWGALA